MVKPGSRFEIRIAGERISVPVRAAFSIEHERSKDGEEIEFRSKGSGHSPSGLWGFPDQGLRDITSPNPSPESLW